MGLMVAPSVPLIFMGGGLPPPRGNAGDWAWVLAPHAWGALATQWWLRGRAGEACLEPGTEQASGEAAVQERADRGPECWPNHVAYLPKADMEVLQLPREGGAG